MKLFQELCQPLHEAPRRMLHRLRRLALPGMVINSLPKAGTHLLKQVVSLLPAARSAGMNMKYFAPLKRRKPEPGSATVLVGVETPFPVPIAAVQEWLGRVRRGHHASWHVPHSPELAALVARAGVRSVLILRDPRDVVVSRAKFALRRLGGSPDELRRWENELIMESIRGSAGVAEPHRSWRHIGERCRSVLPWTVEPFNCTTTFEKLVGPQGGGCVMAQREEIARIARHLGFRPTRRLVERIAGQCFGHGATFRKGAIGGWRQSLTPAHQAAFKEVAGQLLIELGYERDLSW